MLMVSLIKLFAVFVYDGKFLAILYKKKQSEHVL